MKHFWLRKIHRCSLETMPALMSETQKAVEEISESFERFVQLSLRDTKVSLLKAEMNGINIGTT